MAIAACQGHAAEIDAYRIDARIWESRESVYKAAGQPISVPLHMPYGTIMNAMFDPAYGKFVVDYEDGGDSAIWTGHYLAAEAYRYAVALRDGGIDPLTGVLSAAEALVNVRRALDGLVNLRLVTGTGLLARFFVPRDSPFTNAYHTSMTDRTGSFASGRLNGKPYIWVGNTSRDQYSGVMFGLVTAYDLVPDPQIRAIIRREVTAHLNFLLKNEWYIRMPRGHVSSAFVLRPDQELASLQIGRHVNPSAFESAYAALSSFVRFVKVPMQVEGRDPFGSYYKFNLDYINMFSLIRLEDAGSPNLSHYREAYDYLRAATAAHDNAHFNMIDRAITGPSPTRDAVTASLLEQWLQYARRGSATATLPLNRPWTAPAGLYPRDQSHADRTAGVVAVRDRPVTDFLWQRTPQSISSSGSGTTEYPGVDYLLPYWMARFYRVVND